MEYEFDRGIICPWDATADEKRIRQYVKYYKVKYDIVHFIRPQTIIEIGVRAGYSAWAFLRGCPEARYVGFDASNGTHGGRGEKPYTPWAEKILSDIGATFKIYDKFDTQKVDELPEVGDFYHIDGDHSRKGCLHDMNMCFAALETGGYMLIDDYDYVKSVTLAVDDWVAKNRERATISHIESLRGEVLICKY